MTAIGVLTGDDLRQRLLARVGAPLVREPLPEAVLTGLPGREPSD
jgi:hypothetical protein